MSAKKGFTIEEHREAARLMKQADDNIRHLNIKFSAAYGKTKEISLLLEKTSKAILLVKNEADELFCKEVPKRNSPYFGAIIKPGEI